MTLTKAVIVGVALLIETTSAANAQAQYQPSSQYNRNPASQAYPRPQPYSYPETYPSTQAPSISPPWYYDPYTSGLSPLPTDRMDHEGSTISASAPKAPVAIASLGPMVCS